MERVHKAGAKFDYEKAKWYNHEWIKGYAAEGLLPKVKTILEAGGTTVTSNAYLDKVIALVKDRCALLSDFPQQSSFFLQRPNNLTWRR